jgi:uncharacterized membrane protein YheB (UPF0754 family)
MAENLLEILPDLAKSISNFLHKLNNVVIDEVTKQLSEELFDIVLQVVNEKLSEIIDEIDFSEEISEAVNNIDHGDTICEAVQDYLQDNAGCLVEDYLDNIKSEKILQDSVKKYFDERAPYLEKELMAINADLSNHIRESNINFNNTNKNFDLLHKKIKELNSRGFLGRLYWLFTGK